MSIDTTILREHPFFEQLPPRHLELLAGCASPVRFDAGQTIFLEGDPADRFYVIQHGRVALEVAIPGRGRVSIQTVDDGDVLGWSWLFPPYLWVFDARAQDETEALGFDGVCLRQFCAEDHELGYEMMQRFAQIMVQRLQATRLQLLDVYAVHRSREGSYVKS